MIKIAINGFGRIGRIFFRQAFGQPDFDIVAINDLGTPANLAYLLKYDSVYGRYDKSVKAHDSTITVDGKDVKVFQIKEPVQLPWKDLGIDIVVESTGIFETSEKAKPHLDAGAKRVVITAPAKDEVTPTATPNINISALAENQITSNASCTTNATTPIMAVLMQTIGIKKAVLSTIHGYTATQGIVDGPDRKDDYRRARAGAINIVPSTTGAALAAARVVPGLEGKFDGLAFRVPVPAGSLIDFTFVATRPTTVEEINQIFRNAASQAEWQGILTVAEDPLVSSDILRDPHGSIVDPALTKVIDGDLVKICAWYDNEWGYCAMLLKHIIEVSKLL